MRPERPLPSVTDRDDVAAVEAVLTPAEVAKTAASIAAMQEPDGAIPWTTGEHTDVWNHVEAAMALVVGGDVEAAERAYDWVARTQRHDGSWPMKLVAGEVEDHSGETNMSAYLAVGVWHHWLVRRDEALVRRLWPVVRRGLDWVVGMQLPFGGIAWSQEWHDGRPATVNEHALLAGSSSIYQSLRAGVALAELLDEPQPGWELAGGRLGHALRTHRDLFLDKSEYSMDWYYPVLGGAVRGDAGRALLDERWGTFVEPGLGIRCVRDNPWVTGAETCELAMALDALGDRPRALRLLADMQHLRAEDGRYWTGYVFPDDVQWPVEHTTYTAAAVVLAVDALTGATAGSDIMRGTSLAPHFDELALECGCASADRVAGVS
jgi:hypothetical protein